MCRIFLWSRSPRFQFKFPRAESKHYRWLTRYCCEQYVHHFSLHKTRDRHDPSSKMNLHDDPVMDDLLIRGEQARRKRSHKRRRLKPDEVTDNTNLRLETQLQPQQVCFEFRFHVHRFIEIDTCTIGLMSRKKIIYFQKLWIFPSIFQTPFLEFSE